MRDGVSHKSIETIVIDDDDVQLRDLDSLENRENEVNADSFIKMSSKVVEEDSKRTSDDSVIVFIDNDDINTPNDSLPDHDTVRYNTSETSPKDVLSDPSGISIQSLEDGNKLPPQNSSPSYVALPPATIEDSQKETVGKVTFGSDATASRTAVDDVVQGDSDYQRSQKQKYETLTNTDESHTSADDFHVDNSELPEVDTLSSQDGQSIEADVTDLPNVKADSPITVVPLDDEDQLEIGSVIDEGGKTLLMVRKREETEIENSELQRREKLPDAENLIDGNYVCFCREF